MTEIRYPFPEPPAPGAAIEIRPGLLWLRLPLPMALDHVNVYALADPEGWTLIDCGFYSPAMVAEWDKLLAGPLAARPVRRVLITHHHPDHIGMAGWFVARGAELMISRTAWLTARMLVLDEEARPTPEALAFWHRAGLSGAEIARRAGERPFNFADCVHPLPPGFTRLSEGQGLHLGGRDWQIRLGQGHAPDQVTLWSGDLVLGADQLLPSISPNIGVSVLEPEADPLAEWLASCTRLSGFASPGQLVLPGHKLPFTGLGLRLAQLIENHHSALGRLSDWLTEPRRAIECFQPLFRRSIGPREQGLALAETLAHLNYLYLRGQITRAADPEGVMLWQRSAPCDRAASER